jgi:hypothetical protein
MKLAWLTDIHLNFLRPPVTEAFIELLAETEADVFLISGDIPPRSGSTIQVPPDRKSGGKISPR